VITIYVRTTAERSFYGAVRADFGEISVTVHKTIASHGSTTSRRPSALARRRPTTRLAGRDFHVVVAFDYHRHRRQRYPRGIGDDEAVLLICPTCQISAQGVGACDRLLLCMGLFSIFLPGVGAIPGCDSPRCDSPRLTLRANLAIIWPECLSRSSLLPRLSKTSGG
jgi:hypothetical protein